MVGLEKGVCEGVCVRGDAAAHTERRPKRRARTPLSLIQPTLTLSPPLFSLRGEHMHHGLYPPGSPPKPHAAAQADMIDALLAWAGVSGVRAMVDVGCGIGGSSRHVARQWPAATATGFTLSPVQAARANAITAADPAVAGRCTYAVGDALDMPLPDGSADLTWSLESGEHMPDKARFVAELARVTAPGGTVIIATWCHRDLEAGEEALGPKEQKLLAVSCGREMEDGKSYERDKTHGAPHLSLSLSPPPPFLLHSASTRPTTSRPGAPARTTSASWPRPAWSPSGGRTGQNRSRLFGARSSVPRSACGG